MRRKFDWDSFFMGLTFMVAFSCLILAIALGGLYKTMHAFWLLIPISLCVAVAFGRWG